LRRRIGRVADAIASQDGGWTRAILAGLYQVGGQKPVSAREVSQVGQKSMPAAKASSITFSADRLQQPHLKQSGRTFPG
jgi:hypothetical protein